MTNKKDFPTPNKLFQNCKHPLYQERKD